jgi:hypothetical protein
MEHALHKIKKPSSKMDENTYNLSMRNSEPSKSGTVDEIMVRLSNAGCPPKPTKKIISSSKQHCVGDYSCCGQVP